MENVIKCFTDASYSKELGMSIIGYKVGDNEIIIEHLKSIKNTQAELMAIDKCIQTFDNFDNINVIIYTDCQRALKNTYPKNVTIEKIKGHKKKILRDENDTIFHLVDKAVRKELRRVSKLNDI